MFYNEGLYLQKRISDPSRFRQQRPLNDTDLRFFAPLRRFGVHAFFTVEGKAFARNILLDGNTFRF